MTIDRRPIRDYMTPLPHTIGADQSLTSASQRMKQLGIRHLPVLDGGSLVGIVSERDIAFVAAIRSVDATRVPVMEAMTAEPFVVGPEMPLGSVARSMAQRKVGCALVVEDNNVVGILTTTDALALLADLLSIGLGLASAATLPSAQPLPSEIRKRILDEHKVLRQMLGNIQRTAERVLAGDADSEADLNEQARELYQTFLRHIELEDTILAPALKETDSFGPVRAKELEKEHQKQRHQFKTALASIEHEGAENLAKSMELLVPYILKDMKHEEQELLSDSLLKDDPVNADLFAG